MRNGLQRARVRFLAGLALVACVPLLGHAMRTPPGPRCAADGVSLDDAAVVAVRAPDGEFLRFCCVGCASRWLEAARMQPQGVLVTARESGELIDARDAWFVLSRIVSQPATGDHVHVFASQEAAAAHAEAFRGQLLLGAVRPFGGARAEGGPRTGGLGAD